MSDLNWCGQEGHPGFNYKRCPQWEDCADHAVRTFWVTSSIYVSIFSFVNHSHPLVALQITSSSHVYSFYPLLLVLFLLFLLYIHAYILYHPLVAKFSFSKSSVQSLVVLHISSLHTHLQYNPLVVLQISSLHPIFRKTLL